MNKTLLVMKFAIKNQLRMVSTNVITLTIIFICVAGTIAILAALILNPAMAKAAPDMSVLENAMGSPCSAPVLSPSASIPASFHINRW